MKVVKAQKSLPPTSTTKSSFSYKLHYHIKKENIKRLRSFIDLFCASYSTEKFHGKSYLKTSRSIITSKQWWKKMKSKIYLLLTKLILIKFQPIIKRAQMSLYPVRGVHGSCILKIKFIFTQSFHSFYSRIIWEREQ